MQHVSLTIERITPCPRGEHAIVLLVDAGGRLRARVRIGVELGRALPAYDAGFVSGPAVAVVTLTDCM